MVTANNQNKNKHKFITPAQLKFILKQERLDYLYFREKDEQRETQIINSLVNQFQI